MALDGALQTCNSQLCLSHSGELNTTPRRLAAAGPWSENLGKGIAGGKVHRSGKCVGQEVRLRLTLLCFWLVERVTYVHQRKSKGVAALRDGLSGHDQDRHHRHWAQRGVRNIWSDTRVVLDNSRNVLKTARVVFSWQGRVRPGPRTLSNPSGCSRDCVRITCWFDGTRGVFGEMRRPVRGFEMAESGSSPLAFLAV